MVTHKSLFNAGPLTAERILDATEDVLRRFGPLKTTVIDVARLLRVSHGSVYRHFAHKNALLDSVLERWLSRLSGPLAVIAAEPGPAPERLRRWFDVMIRVLRSKAREDPDLFATYVAMAAETGIAFQAHGDRLRTHLAKILDDGLRQGQFQITDPHAAGAALLDATVRFHHPLHAGEWSETNIDREFEAVWSLAMRGLEARGSETARPRF
ncbi:TetR family transcriptional regulator [Beijerinckia indica]|uniref:Transcriptional regulator, TetR family n=1 Tax=Beijerinckia indica subsp. indica (strain ATCC 9039 / DSM 1715 / NCIMB 8712) TaxID=395963 RepID=B2IKR2_BEII9|nr:TetR family transcriptional regulator [Beijerinckia indica]ACB95101.1 transcriptional regulator, TetR family [Beijerinckia indica subsp. indica ATCC 9039]